MLGLAAAPEMVMAVPRETPSPYFAALRYPSSSLPACSAEIVNDRAFRCCQSSRFPATRFRATLTTWKGRRPVFRSHMRRLSFSENPVNELAFLLELEAPR